MLSKADEELQIFMLSLKKNKMELAALQNLNYKIQATVVAVLQNLNYEQLF